MITPRVWRLFRKQQNVMSVQESFVIGTIYGIIKAMFVGTSMIIRKANACFKWLWLPARKEGIVR